MKDFSDFSPEQYMKPRRKGMSLKTFLIFTAIDLIVIVIMLLSSNNSDYSEDKLKANGMLPVQATVTEAQLTGNTEHRSYKYYVSYEVDGLEYTSLLSGITGGLSEGETLTAYYDPNSPSDIACPIQKGFSIGAAVMAALEVLMLIFYLISVKQQKRQPPQ